MEIRNQIYNKNRCIYKTKRQEIGFYMHLIKKTMSDYDSYIELGPGKYSVCDDLENVTILDNDKEYLDRYSKRSIIYRNRETIMMDYHALTLSARSYDNVISIHPDLANNDKNIIWIDKQLGEFTFKQKALEEFVDSLLYIAKKSVLIRIECIAKSPPCKQYLEKTALRPFPYTIYNKTQ